MIVHTQKDTKIYTEVVKVSSPAAAKWPPKYTANTITRQPRHHSTPRTTTETHHTRQPQQTPKDWSPQTENNNHNSKLEIQQINTNDGE